MPHKTQRETDDSVGETKEKERVVECLTGLFVATVTCLFFSVKLHSRNRCMMNDAWIRSEKHL